MNDQSYDLVIVGSGIAGLYSALLAAPHGRVLLVTKGSLEESNTRYAQGGIAVAMGRDDSPELHLRDTIAAGDGLCDRAQVAILTDEAPDCIRDLLARGVQFDRDGEALAWTLEAAHSRPRVIHAGGDATGARVEGTLAQAVRASGVEVRERTLCTSLLQKNGVVIGVELLTTTGSRSTALASHVILATGGAGQLFARTTNPAVATGDGLALAYRAGAQLADLEFFQFHPTALAIDGAPSFLISEAARGEGGILRDGHGRAFMAEYHPDRELAPRDVVARAIHQQQNRTGLPVTLDLTHLDAALIERRFPTIAAFCRQWGVEPTRDPIPVSPAAHYFMGGIRTDAWGRTSLPGLLACGEVACTGVHGANRLASNSLLEGLVFARRAVGAIAGETDATTNAREEFVPLGHIDVRDSDQPEPEGRGLLAEAMWNDAGLVRSDELLARARQTVRSIPDSAMPPATIAEYEMANLTLVAQLIIAAAGARTESRGAHYRTDFAATEPDWRGHLIVERSDIRFLPAAARSGQTLVRSGHGRT